MTIEVANIILNAKDDITGHRGALATVIRAYRSAWRSWSRFWKKRKVCVYADGPRETKKRRNKQ